MPADIVAMRTYYGLNGKTWNSYSDNTIYGFGTNIPGSTPLANLYNIMNMFINNQNNSHPNAFCIVDDGGRDLLNLPFNVDQDLYLQEKALDDQHLRSNVGGLIGNMYIMPGTIIEDAATGSGNDHIYGNNANNYFTSGDGDDLILGLGGSDTFNGGKGRDIIVSGAFETPNSPDLFVYNFGDSLASAPDNIELVYSVDKIRIPIASGNYSPIRLFKLPDNQSATSTASLAQIVFAGLGANTACFVRNTNPSFPSGTYLAINDGNSLFTNSDLFINVFSPSIDSIPYGNIAPSNVFSA